MGLVRRLGHGCGGRDIGLGAIILTLIVINSIRLYIEFFRIQDPFLLWGSALCRCIVLVNRASGRMEDGGAEGRSTGVRGRQGGGTESIAVCNVWGCYRKCIRTWGNL